MCPQMKSPEFRSSDLASYDTELPHPIHLPGNCVEMLLGLCPIMLKPHIMAENQYHTFKQH
jgi:hypothetical protein